MKTVTHSRARARSARSILLTAVACCVAVSGLQPTRAVAAAKIEGENLTDLSLEQLMQVEVTSVSKRKESLAHAAAAIYVLTGDDIRRSGHTTIADALRMVPGLQVAQINAGSWAVGSRGFASDFSNKLLVVMDGRSVYTPLFSGVYWDVQDTLIEDIDRIEVIRSPGATLWGANAVNGVINIITKKAEDTQGALVTGGYGNVERGFAGVRYGTKFGNKTYFRVYGKYFNRDWGQSFATGDSAADEWDIGRTGLRLDSQISEADDVTLQSDFYQGEINDITPDVNAPLSFTTPRSLVNERVRLRGGNVITRWNHVFSDSSQSSLQIYYDRTERRTLALPEDRDTIDLDFQHGFGLGDRNRVTWGGGYRWTHDEIRPSVIIGLEPDRRSAHLVNGFVQDEFTLLPDLLRLTAGCKVEYNTYSEFEYQPSVRFLLTPSDQHTIWGAVSRAVRTPARVDDAIRLNLQPLPSALYGFARMDVGVYPQIQGNSSFHSEELTALELGYRFLPRPEFSVDLTGFVNFYNGLRSNEALAMSIMNARVQAATPGQILAWPFPFDNKIDGHTWGIEMAANWNVTSFLRLIATYSYLDLTIEADRDSVDALTPASIAGSAPTHHMSVRTSLDLPRDIELDANLYYVGELSSNSLGAVRIPSYVGLDLRGSWKPTERLELSVVAQNVQSARVLQFKGGTTGTIGSEKERSIYGKMTWHY